MTHDELLIEINRRLEVALYNGDAQSIHALRAVVELHNPAPFKMTGNIEEIPGLLCLHCSTNLDPKDWVHYPCPTIQAIEKELE